MANIRLAVARNVTNLFKTTRKRVFSSSTAFFKAPQIDNRWFKKSNRCECLSFVKTPFHQSIKEGDDQETIAIELATVGDHDGFNNYQLGKKSAKEKISGRPNTE